MIDDTTGQDIVDELRFYAQRAEADEKVLKLLDEAAGTIQRLRRPELRSPELWTITSRRKLSERISWAWALLFRWPAA